MEKRSTIRTMDLATNLGSTSCACFAAYRGTWLDWLKWVWSASLHRYGSVGLHSLGEVARLNRLRTDVTFLCVPCYLGAVVCGQTSRVDEICMSLL